jgi:hypothetical protein
LNEMRPEGCVRVEDRQQQRLLELGSPSAARALAR